VSNVDSLLKLALIRIQLTSIMRFRCPILIFVLPALCLSSLFLTSAGGKVLTVSGEGVDSLQNKRFEKKKWGGSQSSKVSDKRFPIKEWNKHFSSVGGKRAPISMEANREKTMFKTKTLDQKKVDFGMSRWNQDMAELHDRAGIEIDDRARLAGKQALYSQMMQDAKFYGDTGEVLSMRDINRYQFRRNRSDEAPPVERAGSN
jgi:hypothetical protein